MSQVITPAISFSPSPSVTDGRSDQSSDIDDGAAEGDLGQADEYSDTDEFGGEEDEDDIFDSIEKVVAKPSEQGVDLLQEMRNRERLVNGWSEIKRLITASNVMAGAAPALSPEEPPNPITAYLPEKWTPAISLLLSAHTLSERLNVLFQTYPHVAVQTLQRCNLWLGPNPSVAMGARPLEPTQEDQRNAANLWEAFVVGDREREDRETLELLAEILRKAHDLVLDFGVAEIREVTYEQVETICERYIDLLEGRNSRWNMFVLCAKTSPNPPSTGKPKGGAKAAFVDGIVRMRAEVIAVEQSLAGARELTREEGGLRGPD